MTKIYFEQDGNIDVLKNKTISVIGYGNQGQAQAQNLRDSGVHVVVGNTRDSSFNQALEDGFEVYSVAEAVQVADCHMLLIPDEIMPRVFESNIVPNLKEGDAVVIASGYNVTYGFLKYPKNIDLILVAPRMIGTGVRSGFLTGKGFPSLVAVHQDFSGNAKDMMLALCRGIGTLKGGAVESSCDEETLCDLFNEHFGYVYALRRAYEILVEAGASPEAALLEFWASGEEMELARVHMTHGLFHQLKLHSQTSQYGQEVTSRLTEEEEEFERKRLWRLIRNIKDGSFAKEWTLEQQTGTPIWQRVHAENMTHPMIAEETRLLKALGVLEREEE
jgi:ketol-acid reductoisomerase